MAELTRQDIIKLVAAGHRSICLRGVDLSELDLSYLDLSQADLSYANLEKANLAHAWLHQAGLFNANLAGSQDFTITMWRLETLSLDELRDWIQANRVVRQLTCPERELYEGEPLCEGGTAVTP